MAKKSKGGYYAVQKGRVPGVYYDWPLCEAQVKGFTGAVHKKFDTLDQAEAFVRLGQIAPSYSYQPATSTPSATVSTMAPPPAAHVQCSLRTLPPVLAPQPPQTIQPPAISSAAPSSSKQELQGWTSIYTDGACRGNGQTGSVAGSGVWFGDGHPKNLSERTPGNQTNNRAELIAIVRALEMTHPNDKIIIKTDSTYCQDCIEKWLPNWRFNGFRTRSGEPVKNREIILYLSELLSIKPPGTFRFEKVQAHVGIHGNECADALAGASCVLPWRPEHPDEWDLAKVEAIQMASLPPDAFPEPVVSRVTRPGVLGPPTGFDMFTEDDLLTEEELAAELSD